MGEQKRNKRALHFVVTGAFLLSGACGGGETENVNEPAPEEPTSGGDTYVNEPPTADEPTGEPTGDGPPPEEELHTNEPAPED